MTHRRAAALALAAPADELRILLAAAHRRVVRNVKADVRFRLEVERRVETENGRHQAAQKARRVVAHRGVHRVGDAWNVRGRNDLVNAIEPGTAHLLRNLRSNLQADAFEGQVLAWRAGIDARAAHRHRDRKRHRNDRARSEHPSTPSFPPAVVFAPTLLAAAAVVNRESYSAISRLRSSGGYFSMA